MIWISQVITMLTWKVLIKHKCKANLSLVAAIGALAYGYFTGVFSDDN